MGAIDSRRPVATEQGTSLGPPRRGGVGIHLLAAVRLMDPTDRFPRHGPPGGVDGMEGDDGDHPAQQGTWGRDQDEAD